MIVNNAKSLMQNCKIIKKQAQAFVSEMNKLDPLHIRFKQILRPDCVSRKPTFSQHQSPVACSWGKRQLLKRELRHKEDLNRESIPDRVPPSLFFNQQEWWKITIRKDFSRRFWSPVARTHHNVQPWIVTLKVELIVKTEQHQAISKMNENLNTKEGFTKLPFDRNFWVKYLHSVCDVLVLCFAIFYKENIPNNYNPRTSHCQR